jgi:hypothetical protein
MSLRSVLREAVFHCKAGIGKNLSEHPYCGFVIKNNYKVYTNTLLTYARNGFTIGNINAMKTLASKRSWQKICLCQGKSIRIFAK